MAQHLLSQLNIISCCVFLPSLLLGAVSAANFSQRIPPAIIHNAGPDCVPVDCPKDKYYDCITITDINGCQQCACARTPSWWTTKQRGNGPIPFTTPFPRFLPFQPQQQTIEFQPVPQQQLQQVANEPFRVILPDTTLATIAPTLASTTAAPEIQSTVVELRSTTINTSTTPQVPVAVFPTKLQKQPLRRVRPTLANGRPVGFTRSTAATATPVTVTVSTTNAAGTGGPAAEDAEPLPNDVELVEEAPSQPTNGQRPINPAHVTFSFETRTIPKSTPVVPMADALADAIKQVTPSKPSDLPVSLTTAVPASAVTVTTQAALASTTAAFNQTTGRAILATRRFRYNRRKLIGSNGNAGNQRPKLRDIADGSGQSERICTQAHKTKLDETFGVLLKKLLARKNDTNLAFPVIFSFQKDELQSVCGDYIQAVRTDLAAVRQCRDQYPLFDFVWENLEYPCGYATKQEFFRYFECYSLLRPHPTAVACQKEALRDFSVLQERRADRCAAYEALTDCMHDVVVNSCGVDAFEVIFQSLSLVARQHGQGATKPCLLTTDRSSRQQQ